jgi:hypothetical protein
MANYSTFNEPLVNNSIVNNLNDEKLDRENPFSFMDFLGYTKILDDSLQNVDLYKKYLNKWDNTSVNKDQNETDLIKKQFTDLFKTIILDYTNDEEKRYFSNININNEEDLTISIPFFSKKIKEICQYYQTRRTLYKRDLNQVNKKGSITGVESFIKNKLVDLIYSDNTDVNITKSLTLSSFIQNVEIEIEEGYDVYNDIFDTNPSKVQSFTVEEFYEQEPVDRKAPFSVSRKYEVPGIPRSPAERNAAANITYSSPDVSNPYSVPTIGGNNFYDSPTVNRSTQIIDNEIIQADVLLTTTPLPVTTPAPPVTTPEPIVVPFSRNFWNIENDLTSDFKNFVIAHDAHNLSYTTKNYIDWGDNSRFTTFTQRVTASHDYVAEARRQLLQSQAYAAAVAETQVYTFDASAEYGREIIVTYSRFQPNLLNDNYIPEVSDYWFNTTDTPNKVYQWSGNQWNRVFGQIETITPGVNPVTFETPGVTTTTTPAPEIPPSKYNYNPETGDWF